jgi:hypothetical protein
MSLRLWNERVAFAPPQSGFAALFSPPLLSLNFALVAGAALCFDPRAGRGMACAAVAPRTSAAWTCAAMRCSPGAWASATAAPSWACRLSTTNSASSAIASRRCTRLKGVLRGSDLVGRFGGEEFVALLVGADAREGLCAAARLCKALRRLVVLHKGQEIRVTASVGISAWRPGEESLEPALGRADEALYAAKAAGRDRARVHGARLAWTAGEPAQMEVLAGDTAAAGDAGAPVSLG